MGKDFLKSGIVQRMLIISAKLIGELSIVLPDLSILLNPICCALCYGLPGNAVTRLPYLSVITVYILVGLSVALAITFYAKYFFNAAPSINALVALLGTSATEVVQGLNLTKGTFDPKDFVAYGLGASTFYAVEKIRGRKKVDMQPDTEYSIDPNSDQTLR